MPADPPDAPPDDPADASGDVPAPGPSVPPPHEILRVLERLGSVEATAQRLGLSAARVRHELRTAADALEALGVHRPRRPEPQTELPWARRLAAEPDRPAAAQPPVVPEKKPARPPATPPVAATPAVAAPAEQRAAPAGLEKLRLECDGAARGNPGPAGAGAVLRRPDGKVLERLGRWLGVQTNNVAEYEGLLLGMRRALQLGVRELDVRADSKLVIEQMRGTWKVRHPGLKPLFEEAKALARRFDRVTFAHVPREQNGDADEMSNRAIDERM